MLAVFQRNKNLEYENTFTVVTLHTIQ